MVSSLVDEVNCTPDATCEAVVKGTGAAPALYCPDEAPVASDCATASCDGCNATDVLIVGSIYD